jgi:hypothetical protein
MFAPAFAIFTARMIHSNGVQQIQFDNTFRIQSVPVLGDIPIIGGLFFQNASKASQAPRAVAVPYDKGSR